MIQWFKDVFGLNRKRTPDEIIQRYVDSGADFGDAVSVLPTLGKCLDFDKLYKRWATAEQEYAALGFRTISIDRFIMLGGYGQSVDELLRIKRDVSEPARLHAQIYNEVYGDYEGSCEVQEVFRSGQPAFGSYTLPSTEIQAD